MKTVSPASQFQQQSKKNSINYTKVALRKLDYLNSAVCLDDLKEYYSIPISKQLTCPQKQYQSKSWDIL
jgi:hypothetical protein